MHFYKVPKLGSYLAIRLEYESCLFEEALDAAVIDYLDVRQKLKDQEEEKKQHLEKSKAGAEEDGDGDNTISEGLSTSRKWDEIKPKAFKTKKIQFVVCLNTLGQDREFTPEQIKFAQRTVRDFASQWEKIEHHNLEQDVFLRIASIEHDVEYKKTKEPADNQALEKAVEESVMPREGEEPLDEDTKTATQKKTRHRLMTKAFNYIEAKDVKPKFREHGKPAEVEGAPVYQPLPANQWKEAILTFAKYTVVKMPRVFQAVFYLLGYTREEICERDTNKLEWKKARHVLLGAAGDGAEFFKRLAEFHPFGSKDAQYKLY